MHYVMVSGYPLPARVGGHPALDLCNTWAGWQSPPQPGRPVDRTREYLADFDRFAVWTGHVELLDPTQVRQLRQRGRDSPGRATRTLRDVRRLRAALHDVLLDPSDAEAFATVAEFADRAARASHLVHTATGIPDRLLSAPVDLGLGFLTVAASAEELLRDPRSATVAACPGDDCGWLFLDLRGRRRWCSMTSCGNRAKVRAFADRQR